MLIAGDQDRGERVALVEARGAVHGAVELGFAGNLLRRSRACASSISPAFKSASIAICFPGEHRV